LDVSFDDDQWSITLVALNLGSAVVPVVGVKLQGIWAKQLLKTPL
jgi:hypothetical protein